jgi:hypothetical protein
LDAILSFLGRGWWLFVEAGIRQDSDSGVCFYSSAALAAFRLDAFFFLCGIEHSETGTWEAEGTLAVCRRSEEGENI